VLLGFVVLFYLTDRPEEARWLTAPERTWLVARLNAERQAARAAHPIGAIAALTNRTVWHLGIIFFLGNLGFYAYSIWSPQVIKSFVGTSDLMVGAISGGISAVVIVVMLWTSAHSDRSGERPLHVAIPMLVMCGAFAATAALGTSPLAIIFLALVPISMGAAYGPFWSMPTAFLVNEAAAGGIALVATIVNLSGFVGPTLVGALKGQTGGYSMGFLLLSGAAGAAAVLTLRLRRAAVFAREQRRAPAA
jgi:ACS family tartrate transporter-like MFS transporter